MLKILNLGLFHIFVLCFFVSCFHRDVVNLDLVKLIYFPLWPGICILLKKAFYLILRV